MGIFIGLILGLTIAAAVAYYLGKTGLTTPLGAPSSAKESPRGGRTDLQPQTPEKPRFDFYKILPGAEEPKMPPVRGAEKASDRATMIIFK